MQTLDFSLPTVSSLDFLRHFTAFPRDASKIDQQRARLIDKEGRRLLRRCLMSAVEMRKWRFSTLAAAAICLVRRTQAMKPIWPQELARRTGHSRSQLHACAKAMSELGRAVPTTPKTEAQGVKHRSIKRERPWE